MLLEAAARKDERTRRFYAAMTANLMNCWVKKGHTLAVDDLVGPPRCGAGMEPTEKEQWIAKCRAARAAAADVHGVSQD